MLGIAWQRRRRPERGREGKEGGRREGRKEGRKEGQKRLWNHKDEF